MIHIAWKIKTELCLLAEEDHQFTYHHKTTSADSQLHNNQVSSL